MVRQLMKIKSPYNVNIAAELAGLFALKDKVGGYVRIVRLGMRHSDGSEMARLEWAYPVVKDKVTSHSGKRSADSRRAHPE